MNKNNFVSISLRPRDSSYYVDFVKEKNLKSIDDNIYGVSIVKHNDAIKVEEFVSVDARDVVSRMYEYETSYVSLGYSYLEASFKSNKNNSRNKSSTASTPVELMLYVKNNIPKKYIQDVLGLSSIEINYRALSWLISEGFKKELSNIMSSLSKKISRQLYSMVNKHYKSKDMLDSSGLFIFNSLNYKSKKYRLDLTANSEASPDSDEYINMSLSVNKNMYIIIKDEKRIVAGIGDRLSMIMSLELSGEAENVDSSTLVNYINNSIILNTVNKD